MQWESWEGQSPLNWKSSSKSTFNTATSRNTPSKSLSQALASPLPELPKISAQLLGIKNARAVGIECWLMCTQLTLDAALGQGGNLAILQAPQSNSSCSGATDLGAPLHRIIKLYQTDRIEALVFLCSFFLYFRDGEISVQPRLKAIGIWRVQRTLATLWTRP